MGVGHVQRPLSPAISHLTCPSLLLHPFIVQYSTYATNERHIMNGSFCPSRLEEFDTLRVVGAEDLGPALLDQHAQRAEEHVAVQAVQVGAARSLAFGQLV